jgi:hypothetical protein
MSDELARRAEAVEAEGRSKYGENWGRYVDTLGRVLPKDVSPEAWRQVLGQANAVDVLAATAKDVMIALASDGDDQANRTYSQMREEERREYRLLKNRGPR